ncbi:MAG: heterodisulfide reductase-related iron-sulfur binding cluster [Gammaproteobacteria bacterium]|nr:heterodisulfide reductase-related iron-sulfur binding cluster [Gammaproteobacteria bacterium]
MSDTDTILELADRCVMCGLCLPHCPTYRLLRNEADSPRGRIALMQALAGGKLEASESLRQHLDQCLACRACERMCPSRVEYGRLLDISRAGLQRPPVKPLKALLEAVADGQKLKRDATALRTYQRSGLQWLARRSGLLRGLELGALEAQLPAIPDAVSLERHYPPGVASRGEVGLFVGCIGSIMEGALHLATIRLLNALGYGVHVPAQQGCCGALHHHNGETDCARGLAQANINAFAGLSLDAVISTASGCAAQLIEYDMLYGEALPAPLYEVCDFLQRHWPEEGPTLQPQPLRVALHLPCTQRNVLRRPDAAEQLLRRIPELELEPLAGNELCCGAAGSYMLSEPALAARLRQPKLEAVKAQQPALLLSNNTGCAMHLAGGLKEQGIELEVVHPVLLLAKSL